MFLGNRNKRQNSIIDLISDSACDLKPDLLVLCFLTWNTEAIMFPIIGVRINESVFAKRFDCLQWKLLYYHSDFPLQDGEINSAVSMESFFFNLFCSLFVAELEEKEIGKDTVSVVLYCMLSSKPWSILDWRSFVCHWQFQIF